MSFTVRFGGIWLVMEALVSCGGSSTEPDTSAGDTPGYIDVDTTGEPDSGHTDTPVADNPEFDLPDLANSGSGWPVLNEIRCKDGDYVEIHNRSADETADLSGWVVGDGATADHRYTIEAGTTLEPGAWLVVSRAGDTTPGFAFGLSCAEDTVSLYDPTGKLIDAVVLPLVPEGSAWGRLPDGDGAWAETTPTPGAANMKAPSLDDILFRTDAVADITLTVPDAGIESLYNQPYEWTQGHFAFDSSPIAQELDVGVRLKGHWGSFRTLDEKAAFKISFNFVDVNGRFLGLKRMTLNNMVQDPSMIHELVAYALFRELGIPAPRVGYAWVTLNGMEYGLYAIIESFDDTWLSRTFASTQHLYEGGYGSDFVPGQEILFEIDEGDLADTSDLTTFSTTLQNTPAEGFMTTMADLGDWNLNARTWAMEHFLGHWDGYSIAVNNYYAHFDKAGRMTMIPWGPDQILQRYFGYFEGEGVLFQKCLNSPDCQTIYLDSILAMKEAVAAVNPVALASDTATFLRPWIEADPRKPYTNEEALAGLETSVDYLLNQTADLANQEQCILDPASFDTDGDGRVCDMDCAEGDPITYFGAPEVCDDLVDNDCNLFADDGPECPACPTIMYGSREYSLCFASYTYQDAVSLCAASGKVPVVIDSVEEEDWLRNWLWTYGILQIWLGISDPDSDAVFTTPGGAPASYFNWEDGEPDDWNGLERCVQFFAWRNWDDIACDAMNPVMCETPCEGFVDLDADGFSACHDDCNDNDKNVNPDAIDQSGSCADSIDNNCNGLIDDGPECIPGVTLDVQGTPGWLWIYFSAPATWQQARSSCTALNPAGDLAWFSGANELDAVKPAMMTANGGADFWIGLNDLALEGTFVWADSSTPAFFNWEDGQPNNYGDLQHCCRMQGDGTWNDAECETALPFLCRSPGV